MSKIKSNSMDDCIYAGAHGNMSIAFSSVDLKRAAVGTEIEMLKIPIGISAVGLRVTSSGLGSAVKGDIKLGNTLLAANVDLAPAKSVVIHFPTVYTNENQVLTVSTKGAVATGELNILFEYVSTGY